jgi:predicted nucleic acid-binding protein
MQPVLFDSSVYINAMRTGDEAVLTLRRLTPEAPLWVSAVVLEELYAGVRTRDHKVVERLERDFERARRILIPTLSDWTRTGRVVALLAAEYGYEQIGRAR